MTGWRLAWVRAGSGCSLLLTRWGCCMMCLLGRRISPLHKIWEYNQMSYVNTICSLGCCCMNLENSSPLTLVKSFLAERRRRAGVWSYYCFQCRRSRLLHENRICSLSILFDMQFANVYELHMNMELYYMVSLNGAAFKWPGPKSLHWW